MSDDEDRAEDARATRRMWLEIPGIGLFFIGVAALSFGQWLAGVVIVIAGVLVFAGSLLIR